MPGASDGRRRRRKTRSGRRRWNNSVRPRPSCPSPARTDRNALQDGRDLSAPAGPVRLPAAAHSRAPSAPRRPRGRSARPSPASPARRRRCRTARSEVRLPISCGGARRITSASPPAARTSRAVAGINVARCVSGSQIRSRISRFGIGTNEIKQIGRELDNPDEDVPAKGCLIRSPIAADDPGGSPDIQSCSCCRPDRHRRRSAPPSIAPRARWRTGDSLQLSH